jgi:hypothetical protein
VSDSGAPQQPGFADPVTVKVTCTDRGQHPEALLGNVADARTMGGDGILWPSPVPQGQMVIPHRAFAGKPAVCRFHCRRCGRDVRLREPNLLAAIDVLRHAGGAGKRQTLDISLLC